MNIFITGATGVLGRRLVAKFREEGHSVAAMARTATGEHAMRSMGAEPVKADHFDTDSLARAAEGSDVVIHAATAIPAKVRYSAADWELNDRLRREGMKALAACAAKIGAKLLLYQSIVWVARPPDCTPFNEDSPAQPEGVFASAVDGENIARESGNKHGYEVGIFRCGMFYSADSSHMKMLRDGLLRRKIPVIGDGAAVWAMIHPDDAASAFVRSAQRGIGGLWHVVDDTPVTVKDFLMELARMLRTAAPRHVPVWLARLLIGRAAVTQFTCSTLTSNARIRKQLGWSPQFPGYKEGLQEIAIKWSNSETA